MTHLRGQGHQGRVLTSDFRTASSEPDDPDTFRELHWYWRNHAWPHIGWRERIALERHNARVLDRHLAELSPDVVTWWAMGGMSLALIERVRRAGIPAVAFVHDDWLLYGPRFDRWIRRFRKHPRLAALAEQVTGLATRVDLEDAAHYVFVSEAVREHARAAGYRLGESSIAHSGIDPSYINALPERPWDWRLLYVGRIDERKGISDALAALAELPSNATLTLVGEGDPRFKAQLRKLAKQLGIEERVHELGMRSRAELPHIYSAADVVLFPARWNEPWGLVPLEAMGLGRPVVATGLGGSGEYLRDGVNCLLVPPADPGAIASAVNRVAGDPGLRRSLRAGGVQTARRHTEADFNATVLDVLIGVVAKRHRGL
jgi:glycosyltransferase involved in cell wall biosynthesis